MSNTYVLIAYDKENKNLQFLRPALWEDWQGEKGSLKRRKIELFYRKIIQNFKCLVRIISYHRNRNLKKIPENCLFSGRSVKKGVRVFTATHQN